MQRLLSRGLLMAYLVLFTGASSFAQDLTTTRLESGYLFDHPEEWRLSFSQEVESIAYFNDGAMYGLISILDNRFLGDNPEEILEEILDELAAEDSGNGDFEEPFESYSLNETWELVRASRVRYTDRLLEYFIMADGNDTSVFLRASFRRGLEETYLPQLDAVIASIRHEDDESTSPESTETSTAELLDVETIGTEGNLLQISALTENYIFTDQRYEIDYPRGWDISTNEDGSLRFINRDGITLLGSLHLLERGEATAESALTEFLATEEGYSPIESFSLNGLPAARAYREDSRGGTKELAMAAQHSDVIVVLTAASNLPDFDSLEPILCAVLYSFRPNGTELQLSLLGTAARTGLDSAYIYGATINPNSEATIPQISIPLESSFETRNGNYRFNYPEGWTQEMERTTVVLSNREDYELFNPNEGEVQMMIFFIDRIDNLQVDEFSPRSLLEYIIANDTDPEFWRDISDFTSGEHRAAYADFVGRGLDWTMRSYMLELDETEHVYVRIDMVTKDEEVESFHPYALGILETIDFAD